LRGRPLGHLLRGGIRLGGELLSFGRALLGGGRNGAGKTTTIRILATLA
jgi:hypothetical protein